MATLPSTGSLGFPLNHSSCGALKVLHEIQQHVEVQLFHGQERRWVRLGVAEVGLALLEDPGNMLVERSMVGVVWKLLGVGTVLIVVVKSVAAVLLAFLVWLVVGTVWMVVLMLLLMSVSAVPLKMLGYVSLTVGTVLVCDAQVSVYRS